MKKTGMLIIAVTFFLCAPAAAQGINVPQSLTVGEDGMIYVAGNTLRPDGGAEIYVIAVDPDGKMQGAALTGNSHSLAAGMGLLRKSVVVCATELRSETDQEIYAIGYDLARLVGNSDLAVPSQFTMSPIWPNPASAGVEAAVDLGIAAESRVTIDLYQTKGNVVARIMDTNLSPGMYTARFDTRTLPNGTYFCMMNANGVKKIQKLAVVR